MIKQYLKQAWQGYGEHKLQSRLTILGTALSIAMIMVLVLVDQVKNGPFPPETHRREMLIVRTMTVETNSDGMKSWSLGGSGLRAIKEFYADLESTEMMVFTRQTHVSLAKVGSEAKDDYTLGVVSERYWQFFDFHFVDGAPFTDEEVKSGISNAVISTKVAEELFGGEKAVGKTIYINGRDAYKVVGVVRQPSILATYAYGHIWIPYLSPAGVDKDMSKDEYQGSFSVLLRTDGNGSKNTIRKEVQERVDQINKLNPEVTISLLDAPDTYRVSKERRFTEPVDLSSFYIRQIVLLCLFFFVPAVNIASLTHSRMKKRIAEIGLRKAYGANNSHILNQVVWESLLFTLIGTAIGFAVSLVAIYAMEEIFFGGSSLGISLWTLVRPEIIGIVVLVALLLNVVSAVIPAVLASRRSIIDALERS